MNIAKYLISKRELIDSEIEYVLPKDSPIADLYDAQWKFLGEGGKRWRPVLCLLVHEALGGASDLVLPFAAAVELVHNFSLIHDDIEDEDRERRGHPTLWYQYGVPKAINIGDSMLNKAYESVLRLSDKGWDPKKVCWCLESLCRAAVMLSEGQAMEMNFRQDWDITEDQYMEMVWKKTGVLVSSAASAGAYLAGADRSVVSDMEEYGRLIGPAFQITDDVLNVSGRFDKYQKEIGGDIGEGKKTLMIIHLLGHAKRDEADRVKDILAKPRKQTTLSDSQYVIGLMKRYGSIDYARRVAEEKMEMAKEKLMALPEGPQRDLLLQLSDFLVRREF